MIQIKDMLARTHTAAEVKHVVEIYSEGLL
jgi:hypothetical protein